MSDKTLLERFDLQGLALSEFTTTGVKPSEIRRAIAIAQAVEESANEIAFDTAFILRRADELLEGK